MSILDHRDEYMKNQYFKGHVYGDYTPFYVTITICTVIGLFLIVLNVVFCWCSRHKDYWQNPHTGNRWIQPLWTTLPHNNPPLDLSELESVRIVHPPGRQESIQYHQPESHQSTLQHSQEYIEMQKRESEI